ncbi:MAG TPA: ABC transporter ATP-binding protein [Solirubrobacteraceae bacterium]|nr:ABC transporter ATP-binding protein [Solirubrobacteraceae bacterium]
MSATQSAPPKTPQRGGDDDQPLLELEDVVKHYHSTGEVVRAVDGVSFSLCSGEMLALHGPSGSGKTTLLFLAAGLMRPEGGTLRFRGRDLATMPERELSAYLRGQVGFIHQHTHLMGNVSALENACLYLILGGLSLRQAKAAVIPWLERVGLGDRLSHTPEQLSGGERQRLAIARVLAKHPRLILADEPTGNLDSVRSHEIVALLHSIARERSAGVLLVTHDLEAAGAADRRMVLRDGRLLEAGDQEQARALIAGGPDGHRRP